MARKLETQGYTYVSVTVVHVTDRAVLVNDGTREEWIPTSQIEDPAEFTKGETVDLLLPEWLAKEKRFV